MTGDKTIRLTDDELRTIWEALQTEKTSYVEYIDHEDKSAARGAQAIRAKTAALQVKIDRVINS